MRSATASRCLHLGLERVDQLRRRSSRPSSLTRAARPLEQLGGRPDADVGPDQRLLELVPGLVVDRGPTEEAGERAAGLGQPVPERRALRRGDDLGLDDDDRVELGDRCLVDLGARADLGLGGAATPPRGSARRLELDRAGERDRLSGDVGRRPR